MFSCLWGWSGFGSLHGCCTKTAMILLRSKSSYEGLILRSFCANNMREHQIYISAKLRRRLFFLRELEKDGKKVFT